MTMSLFKDFEDILDGVHFMDKDLRDASIIDIMTRLVGFSSEIAREEGTAGERQRCAKVCRKVALEITGDFLPNTKVRRNTAQWCAEAIEEGEQD